MRASFSLIFGAMALAVGCDALADGSGRMGEVERTRLRAELLRMDVAGSRAAPAVRPEAVAPGAGAGAGTGAGMARLSPEERRALREQLRQNMVPFEARSPRPQAQPRRQPPR